jgi:hypothetical protein
VTIGGHGAEQPAGLGILDGVEIDAVEIVARLFVGDRELGAFDELAQRCSGNVELMGKGAGLEIGEALGRQAGQIETRAA